MRYPSRVARGTYHDRHGTLTRVAMDVAASGGFARRTKTPAAYGEIVWSWRRDPGATCGSLLPHYGGKKGRSPGRARISRQTIARGKPGCLGCTCQIRVHSFAILAHGAAGAVSARLSLRPLLKRGTTRLQDSGENLPRERARMFPRHCEERSDEAIQLFSFAARWIASLRSQ